MAKAVGTYVVGVEGAWLDNLVCPYCGHTHADPASVLDGEEDVMTECDACSKPFFVATILTTKYTTRKA